MDLLLPSSFKQLMEAGDYADCCVIVGTRRFPCHKVILGAASEFFKRTFQPGFAEAETGEVTLTGVTEDTFEKFRLYVYTYDRTSLKDYSNQVIIKLMECANMWMVEPLQLACEDNFKKRYPKMMYSDMLLYFEHGHHVHDMKLIDKISEGLKQNIVAKSIPGGIYELGSDVFREYLKTIEGSVEEITRFHIVEKYVAIHGFELDQNQSDLNKIECKGLENKRETNPETPKDLSVNPVANPKPIEVKNSNFSDANSVSLDPNVKKIHSHYIETLLSLIDFSKMTVNEFFGGPGKSKIVSLKNNLYFLYQIAERLQKTVNEYNYPYDSDE
ncbi:kelch-like protein 40 [Drosophila takahashii]|uniref:kelch-like protein 40 n=1 Tax=Drosophila takahashii TaxID=29030 RepID=UPI001CF899DD|nr:uncharacterized protein LOC108057628 [Drosophila takahashii]